MVYTDTTTAMSTTYTDVFKIGVITTQKGATALIITSDSGLMFKNGDISQQQSMILTATLMRGSTVDTTNLTYQWQQDGVNIPSSAGTWLSAGNAQTLTVKAGGINSSSIFKCTVTDSVEGDNYSNTVTILDVTDAYSCDITSSIGSMFKRGDATVGTLTAGLYQNGAPITLPLPANTTYKWTKLSKTGSAENWSSAAPANQSQTVSFALNVTTTSGSTTCTTTSTTGLTAGMKVCSNPNIPTNTTIASITNGTTFVLSAAATTSGTAVATDIVTTTVAVATTSGSVTVTCPNTACLSVGNAISGTNIPAGSTIASIVNATTFTISANATATGSGIAATITGNVRIGSIATTTITTADISSKASILAKVIF
jgi:hypothetical protein